MPVLHRLRAVSAMSGNDAGLVEQVSPRGRAWLAASLGIPTQAALAALLGPTGQWLFSAVSGEALDSELVVVAGVIVAAVNLLIVVVGIVAVTHTLGMALDRAAVSRRWTHGRAAAAFGVMGGVLGLLPLPLFLIEADHPAAGALLVFVGVALPSAVTAALTRLLLPVMLSHRTWRSVLAFVAAATVVGGLVAALWIVGVLG